MSYGKVHSRFWTEPPTKALSDDAKLLTAYFMTGPHRNIAGVARIPTGYIIADLGWTEDRVNAALTELCATVGFVRDNDGWTFCPLQLEYDPPAITNHGKAAIRIASGVPRGPVFDALKPRLLAVLKALGMASEWQPDAIATSPLTHSDDIAIPAPAPAPAPAPSPAPGRASSSARARDDDAAAWRSGDDHLDRATEKLVALYPKHAGAIRAVIRQAHMEAHAWTIAEPVLRVAQRPKVADIVDYLRTSIANAIAEKRSVIPLRSVGGGS